MPRSLLVAALLLASAALRGQAVPPYQTDFPVDELQQRRARVMDAIGAGRTTLAPDPGHHAAPAAPRAVRPFSPAEGEAQSRDEILGHQAGVAGDPWDGRPSREAHFLGLVADRFPALERRDLTPILDGLRYVKSPREIALIRQASVLAGLGLLEAMKSTLPGVREYEVAAAARFTFLANGARVEGSNPIAGGGTNAWYGHYWRNLDPLKAGDMVLMDYAPDLRYYTSDVTRMWPVIGAYTPAQRTLATFILQYRDAFFRYIRPGITPDEIQTMMKQEGILRRVPRLPSRRNRRGCSGGLAARRLIVRGGGRKLCHATGG